MKNLLMLACSLALLTTACKKKAAEEAKATDPTMESGSAAPGSAATPDKPAETKPAAGGIANAAEYEAKGTEMIDKMAAIFSADGTDCAKLAADVSKFIEDNKALVEAAEAFEKANPDAKKAFDDKVKDKNKAFEEKAGAAMAACKDDKAFNTSMSKIPG